ncbi:ribosome-binding factor A [Candidatus Berkelbacteria bacterium]|nr:ribosome-binding factor A [Candidatus Berkelbacteria bacterium]
MPRVDAQLHRVVSQLIAELYDAGADRLTVTGVHTTRDLKSAQVALTASAHDQVHLRELERIQDRIQRELGGRLRLKFTPHLTFRLDTHSDEIGRVESLLDRL